MLAGVSKTAANAAGAATAGAVVVAVRRRLLLRTITSFGGIVVGWLLSLLLQKCRRHNGARFVVR